MDASKMSLVAILSAGLPFVAAAQTPVEELVAFPAGSVSLRRPGSLPGADGRMIEQEIVLNGFAIARTEVTQESFERVMGRNPSQHTGANLPVTNVSWRDAVEYCNRRSEQDGLVPGYDLATYQCDFRKDGYRLPTEAEWLYAAQSSTVPTEHPERANLGSKNTKLISQLHADLRERTIQPVGRYTPNARGLHDMLGNVWEWTYDRFNTQTALVTSTEFPSGPSMGLERVILGGSYRSGFWGRRNQNVAAGDFRRGFPESARSPYTGFRVCRTIPNPNYISLATGKTDEWLAQFDQAPEGYRGALGDLTPLATGNESAAQWQARAKAIREKWSRILGKPSGLTAAKPKTRLLRTVEESFYTGQLMELQTEPDRWEKIYLMIPAKPVRRPMPVVIVPYYDIDTPAGKNLGGHVFDTSYVRQFGRRMAERGFAVLSIRWWGESYGEDYAESVSNLYERHPEWTGLGKWVFDSQRALDYLETVDGIDMTRVGMIGHSLGGKMTLYAAAMDPRVAVAVSSEPGIGLDFSNYDDYWYLSKEAIENSRPFDQHELLALVAPRPFLLIGGESSDTDKSWRYINAAKAVYQIHGMPKQIGYYNHRQGHTPTIEALELSLEWLDHFLLRVE
jgi:formylglycine-generating enzyme required for sulfatase activity/pimeloyl-ACP methyl ester carboxylesterase